MLSEKERLRLALKGKKVDRPPCICPGGMMNMIVEEVMDLTHCKWPEAHTNSKIMADLAAGMYKNGGFENFGVPFCMTIEAESMGSKVFLGTKISEPRISSYAINSVTEWKKLKNLDINSGRAQVVLDAIKLLKDKNADVPIIANLTGPISTASSLMEPVKYYKELIVKPKESHEMMDFVTDNLINFGKAQLNAGADLITISDPSGTGEILGSRTFRKYGLFYINKIIDGLSKYSKYGIIVHICGRLKSIYTELNELHSDAISFDAVTSIKKMCENVTNKAIMGNVSTFSLQNSSLEEVTSLSKNCLKSGVHILSPACGLGTTTPLKNIQAMVQTARNFKKE
ncbi:methylcobamide:CoM methyltransferase MtbA [Clostridium sp. AWRP]|uniref:methylcobamide:CoM methyltransferase MtbA n=1 Tax=Clostridium sp. AWRP TaxID=2212991 RepID=UPI000FD71F33|nr:methylcobamide:CoM methyltransferase MtbA [Clostridium sp. AWRP]AZV57043.1 MtaA/CmuA family methyltransferase [Clostridium sp. AWRP]